MFYCFEREVDERSKEHTHWSKNGNRIRLHEKRNYNKKKLNKKNRTEVLKIDLKLFRRSVNSLHGNNELIKIHERN